MERGGLVDDLRWLEPNVRALPPAVARAWPVLHGAQVACAFLFTMALSDVPGVSLGALAPWCAVQLAAIRPGRHLSDDAERMRVGVHGLSSLALAFLGSPGAAILALGIPAVTATVVHGAAPMRTWRSGIVLVTGSAAAAAIPGGLTVAALVGFGLLGLFLAMWELMPPRGVTRLSARTVVAEVDVVEPWRGPQGVQAEALARVQRGPGAPDPVA